MTDIYELSSFERRDLRDRFAGQAMAAMIADTGCPEPKVVAEAAYSYAEAMMQQRIRGISDENQD